ncbi:TPA: L-2-amino-thiazoline-4-carboxylic acid hydrolase [Candidatus Bathyarchaeota archaeon]|nr:L-2-amino-thiazoline-4-carboxylic acid hydrolase [Candidatus Bathyarchaeota archaeon]
MSSEGVRRGYTLLTLYIIEVIKDLGTQPSLDKLMEAAERQGELIAKEMRKQMPAGLTPLETGVEVYRRFMADAGAEVSVHKRDAASVTFVVMRCPFHEAFLEVGVDCGIFLKGLCSSLTLPAIQATLNQFDTRLRVENVVARASAEEMCLERVYIE